MAEILVLGAGMVGVSTALALQARGHAVSLVDRSAPGRETSFGNAGIIQAEAAEPYGLPRDLGTLWSMVSGRSNDVTWSLRGVTQMAPALWSYFRQSAPRRHAEISRTYAQLTARATQDHAPLVEAAGAGNLIARQGMVQLYRDRAAFDADAAEAERLRRDYGVRHRALSGEDYRREDPALLRDPAGIIHWTDSWSCSAPGCLVHSYAKLFASRGGRLLEGDAASLRHSAHGWTVNTVAQAVEAEHAIVALGPWSPTLLRRFGYRIPMIYKRGYHGHFETPRPPLRPIVDMDNGVVAGQMRAGLRIATGAALVTRKAPADLRQLDRGRAALSDMLEIGARVDEPQWSGTRPCLPDMLPLVGAAPRHQRLWFHFGHGHQGFTLGPTTGALLAAAIDGEETALSRALAPAHRL
ncbi:NAD(P)/FAD-dependent oxidoreductase [Salipiger mangrovisoli]|uniref:FAD-binding oxidoreductase n=1 Tax=Salipiger mangrovisoli TaxID=2865933 RepID=A0ABR9WZR5_9RHOB|nr:FAD-dependent oxidoreductase [Salipiger mangrovisoli]MBE9636790.1 FAD-binding oxidoreductase [Salipiger mangrovisoli]